MALAGITTDLMVLRIRSSTGRSRSKVLAADVARLTAQRPGAALIASPGSISGRVGILL
jgi:hypothetical protein